MHSVAFRFGADKEHELRIESYMLGRDKFFVDGDLVLSKWSMSPKAKREFVAYGHRITIQVAVRLKRVQMDGYVDGLLVAPDLFADFNQRIAELRAKRLRHPLPLLLAWMFVCAAVSYIILASHHAS